MSAARGGRRHWLERGVGSALAPQAGDSSRQEGTGGAHDGWGGGRCVILTCGGALAFTPGSWSVPASESHSHPAPAPCPGSEHMEVGEVMLGCLCRERMNR